MFRSDPNHFLHRFVLGKETVQEEIVEINVNIIPSSRHQICSCSDFHSFSRQHLKEENEWNDIYM